MFSSVSARVAPVGARRVHVGHTKTRGVSAARSQPPARPSLKSAVLGRGLTARGSRNSVSNAALIADVVRPTHKATNAYGTQMCSVLAMYDPNAAMEDGREELMRELSAKW